MQRVLKRTSSQRQLHQEEDLHCQVPMLIIPSLISGSTNKSKMLLNFGSLDDIRDQLVSKDTYEITYEFGKTNCFAASGVMDVFLVEIYTSEKWDLDCLRNANSYKENIERRKPGLVFAIEFNPHGSEHVTITEEESCGTKNEGSFYNSRIIRIFTPRNLIELFQNAMDQSIYMMHKKTKSHRNPHHQVSYKIRQCQNYRNRTI